MVSYDDRADQEVERTKQRARDDKRQKLHALLKEMDTEVTVLDRELKTLVSQSERVSDDGECSYQMTVDETPLAHPDKKETLNRRLLHATAIDSMKDMFEKYAHRRGITPFTFEVLDRQGTTILSMYIDAWGLVIC